jgi:tight adherence protein C
MIVFKFLALLLGFGAGFIGLYALMPSPSQVYELRQRAATRAEAQTIASPLLRLLWPLILMFLPLAKRYGKPAYREQKAQEIPLAGLPPVMTVDHLIGMKFVLAIVGLLVGLMYSGIVVGLIAAVVGFVLPDRMVTEQKRAREMAILRALPGSVDMLTLAVEAGLDFVAGLQRVIDKGAPGPLREEVATIINDIRLGDSRSGALRSFGRRINIPEVVSFVGVLVQADRLGASIGEVLRSQADRMRTERFQRAEKAGAAASQKLLIPLAVFIFPAVILVLVGPVVLSFVYGVGF